MTDPQSVAEALTGTLIAAIEAVKVNGAHVPPGVSAIHQAVKAAFEAQGIIAELNLVIEP